MRDTYRLTLTHGDVSATPGTHILSNIRCLYSFTGVDVVHCAGN